MRKTLLLLTCALALFVANPTAAAEKTYINLLVPIPLPNCAALGDTVQCDGQLVVGVTDFAAFTVALYQFGVILLSVLLVGIMMVGGLMYLGSAGLPGRAQKGMDYIKNAAFALLVLIFSVVILTQVNPALVNLSLKGAQTIEGVRACNELNQDTCSTTTGCIWLGSFCDNIGQLDCENITEENVCTAAESCEWISSSKTCITPRPDTAGTCNAAEDQGQCASFIGCVWDLGCTPKDWRNPLADKCNNFVNQQQCTIDPLCQWGSGCIDQAIAYAKTCDSYVAENECPTVNCFWDKTLSTPACKRVLPPGAPCQNSIECGSNFFCQGSSKPGVCTKRLGGNEVCDGLAVDDDDLACLSGECREGINANLGCEF